MGVDGRQADEHQTGGGKRERSSSLAFFTAVVIDDGGGASREITLIIDIFHLIGKLSQKGLVDVCSNPWHFVL